MSAVVLRDHSCATDDARFLLRQNTCRELFCKTLRCLMRSRVTECVFCLQIDLRDDPKTIAKLNDMKEKPVATEQGQKLAKEVFWPRPL